jgi:hypothetical protein
LPESGEVFLVAGDQVVGVGGLSAFQEHVVVGILADRQFALGNNHATVFANQIQHFLAFIGRYAQFRTRQNLFVLSQDLLGHEQAGWPRQSENQGCPFQSFGFERTGDDHIGVDDEL